MRALFILLVPALAWRPGQPALRVQRRDALSALSGFALVGTSPLFDATARAADEDAIAIAPAPPAPAPPAPAPPPASRPSFTRTDRGLEYELVREGAGPKPARGQSVRAQYTLALGGFAGENGAQVVDSSRGLLKPPQGFAFYAGVGAVIKGWDLAVMDMRPGEARRLIIPADLGYGAKGAGGKIPGGATLYFDIELAGVGDPPVLDERQLEWLEKNPL